jgi:hypothetical protein
VSRGADPNPSLRHAPGPEGCPILAGADQVRELSNDLAKTMRKLRRDLNLCSRCPAFEGCGLLKELNAVVQAALDQIMDEWDLSSILRDR